MADDLPAAFEQLQRVKGQQRQAASRRSMLEEQHRYLVDKSRELRQDAEKALIDKARMVATTLARSRLHRALATASFDVVLVDEAGAATLIEVLLALCRATTTAVLFGDFLQLPPVQNSRLTNSTHQALRRWVLPNPFTHINIRTPTEALEHPGCVPLLHQFRFGPRLRRLANDVIYEVLCDASELPDVTIRADTDIVFVDTSGLGELTQIHHPGGKRGWWPAGLVLSRALAEHHLPEDGEVGIITPYGHQRDATLAGLRDHGLVTGVPVGTVHAFQGREFPTVVFDLVEDGHGWIAQARRDRGKYEDDGVRLFGVGITRAQHRFYLIGDRGAVRQAAHGPLSAVRDAGLREQIQVWSGAALLGMVEPPQFIDSAFTQVSEMLRNRVTVTDISDEKTFYAELERALNSASRRVWMWSPWISTRAEQITPLITAAVSRNVNVCVFLRPDDDRNMARNWAQRQLPALYSSGATVIRSDHEHRKIVVIDEQTVLFGSLNTLSNSKGSNTRESMLTLKGGEFAHRLLEELRVRELGTPRPCVHCAKICQVKREGGKRTAWSWYCASCQRSEVVPESTQHR
jgi:AAA domain-containing protein/phospholipase D-like protein